MYFWLAVSFVCLFFLNISSHSLLACKVSAEKFSDRTIGVPLNVTSFSLAAFEILYKFLKF